MTKGESSFGFPVDENNKDTPILLDTVTASSKSASGIDLIIISSNENSQDSCYYSKSLNQTENKDDTTLRRRSLRQRRHRSDSIPPDSRDTKDSISTISKNTTKACEGTTPDQSQNASILDRQNSIVSTPYESQKASSLHQQNSYIIETFIDTQNPNLAIASQLMKRCSVKLRRLKMDYAHHPGHVMGSCDVISDQVTHMRDRRCRRDSDKKCVLSTEKATNTHHGYVESSDDINDHVTSMRSGCLSESDSVSSATKSARNSGEGFGSTKEGGTPCGGNAMYDDISQRPMTRDSTQLSDIDKEIRKENKDMKRKKRKLSFKRLGRQPIVLVKKLTAQEIARYSSSKRHQIVHENRNVPARNDTCNKNMFTQIKARQAKTSDRPDESNCEKNLSKSAIPLQPPQSEPTMSDHPIEHKSEQNCQGPAIILSGVGGCNVKQQDVGCETNIEHAFEDIATSPKSSIETNEERGAASLPVKCTSGSVKKQRDDFCGPNTGQIAMAKSSPDKDSNKSPNHFAIETNETTDGDSRMGQNKQGGINVKDDFQEEGNKIAFKINASQPAVMVSVLFLTSCFFTNMYMFAKVRFFTIL